MDQTPDAKRVLRASLLQKGVSAVESAFGAAEVARHAVIPSGDRCALTRQDNYAYQTALREARGALQRAHQVLDRALGAMIPCGATDGLREDDSPLATCGRPAEHDGGHLDLAPDGTVLAEWRGLAPTVSLYDVVGEG